jgi:hypothetical protein
MIMKKQIGKRLLIGANLLWTLCAAQSAVANTDSNPKSWGKSAGNSTLYGGFTWQSEPETSAGIWADYLNINTNASQSFDVNFKVFGNNRPALYLSTLTSATDFYLGTSYGQYAIVNGKEIHDGHSLDSGTQLDETYSPDGISKTFGSWSTSFTVGICPSVNVKATVTADLKIKLRSVASVTNPNGHFTGTAKSSIVGGAGLNAKLSASCGVSGVLAVGVTGNFRLIDVEVGPSTTTKVEYYSGAKSVASSWSHKLDVDVNLLSGSVYVTVDTAIKDYKEKLFSWGSVYDEEFTPISDSGSKTLNFE